MTTAILCCTGVLLLWALFSKALRRWRITGPMVMVLGGMVIALSSQFGVGPPDFDLKVIEVVLTGSTAQRIAEVILALVLFTDSFEIRQGILGHEPRPALRLLFIALPLSVVAALGIGVWAFPEMSVAAVLALVCAVVPSDLGPASHVLKDDRIPERVRNLLNVESGYNDGIVAPIFIFALTLAGSTSHASTPQQALDEAFPASLKAIAIGVLVGLLAGLLKRWTSHRDWTSSSALRFGVLCIPLISYAAAVQVHGNGFIAAFVAGLAYRAARGPASHDEASLTEDVGVIASYVLWFVLGAFSVLALDLLLSWQVVLFSFAALTWCASCPCCCPCSGRAWGVAIASSSRSSARAASPRSSSDCSPTPICARTSSSPSWPSWSSPCSAASSCTGSAARSSPRSTTDRTSASPPEQSMNSRVSQLIRFAQRAVRLL